MSDLKARPDGCEDASALSTTHYIPCDRPAVFIVKNQAGTKYRMCQLCAQHSVQNRRMEIVETYKTTKAPNFEMAHADKPEEIIQATQKSLISAMRTAIQDLKTTVEIKQPGLTWEQIEYFLDRFEKKAPKIFFQEKPQ